MRQYFLLAILVYNVNYGLTAQSTYVPDDNFEQKLIDLGYDDVLDDYVLTANISGVFDLDIQFENISDVTGLEDFASLSTFNCDNNQISNLNFHPDANLNFLICKNNPLTSLDLTQHTALFELSCSNTSITNLDLSQNTSLSYFTCRNTLLAELDLSNNTNLFEISASGNNLEFVDLRNGSNTELSSVRFDNNPDLTYILVDDCNYSTTNWTNVDPITTFIEEEGQTTCMSLGVNDISSSSAFKIHPNPSNSIIHLSNNSNLLIKKINIIDISGKTILELKSNFNLINIENIKSGIYFLNVETASSMTSIKVVKL